MAKLIRSFVSLSLPALLSLSVGSIAFASGFEINCETPQHLDGRIEYCTQNRFAVESANDCADRLQAEFDAAGPELSQIFNLARGQDAHRQKKEFQFSESDYQHAKEKLGHLIHEAQYNMDLLANYPSVMLDDPEHSVPCFLENRADLGDVVADIDDQITELKKARKIADSLRGIVGVSDNNIENLAMGGGNKSGIDSNPPIDRNHFQGSGLSGSVGTDGAKGQASSTRKLLGASRAKPKHDSFAFAPLRDLASNGQKTSGHSLSAGPSGLNSGLNDTFLSPTHSDGAQNMPSVMTNEPIRHSHEKIFEYQNNDLSGAVGEIFGSSQSLGNESVAAALPSPSDLENQGAEKTATGSRDSTQRVALQNEPISSISRKETIFQIVHIKMQIYSRTRL